MEGGLRAITAVFGTAAGLDRQQGGKLHRIRVEMRAVHLLRAIQQVRKRKLEQGLHCGHAPALRRIAARQFGGTDEFDSLCVHKDQCVGYDVLTSTTALRGAQTAGKRIR
jgi:hypothetical protein